MGFRGGWVHLFCVLNYLFHNLLFTCIHSFMAAWPNYPPDTVCLYMFLFCRAPRVVYLSHFRAFFKSCIEDLHRGLLRGPRKPFKHLLKQKGHGAHCPHYLNYTFLGRALSVLNAWLMSRASQTKTAISLRSSSALKLHCTI